MIFLCFKQKKCNSNDKYTNVQKFVMFLKEVTHAHQVGIYLIKNITTVMQWKQCFLFCFILIFLYFSVIYSCGGKAEISASLLQLSVSHDPSEIILIYWFGAQETFLIIIAENRFRC